MVTWKQGLKGQHYLGFHQVPVRQIIGSLGRYRDFDRAFLPLQTHLLELRPSARSSSPCQENMRAFWNTSVYTAGTWVNNAARTSLTKTPWSPGSFERVLRGRAIAREND